MKVLVINIDKSTFERDSTSLKRLQLYAGFCEKMKVVVLTRQKFAPIKEGNLEVYATGSRYRLKYLFDVWRLVSEICKKEKMDLVMTQDPSETGIFGWLTKRKYKMPWQCQIHGDIFSPYFRRESFSNKIRVVIAKFLLPKADGLRVVSQRIKNSLAPLALKAKVTVLPIFVDKEKFESAVIETNLKQKYPQFDFLILMASRLSKEKNISLAIDAISQVFKKHERAGLLIVGEGTEKRRLIKKAEKLKLLGSNIIFEPWSLDLASYYKGADLFLLTSNYEGWGMTVVEAAVCGCPIVMTNVGCAGELIKDGESGVIVKVGDKEMLASAILKMIEDEGLAKKLSQEAKNATLSLPNKQEYLEIYEQSFASII